MVLWLKKYVLMIKGIYIVFYVCLIGLVIIGLVMINYYEILLMVFGVELLLEIVVFYDFFFKVY